MAKRRSKPLGTMLLALLVVVATSMAMYRLSGDDEKTPAQAESAGDESVEAVPVMARGRITAASWRTGDEPSAEGKEAASGVDWSRFGDAAEQRRKREEDLKKTIRDINGLAVHVVAEDD